jgi:Mg-chelatase subunit ChlD
VRRLPLTIAATGLALCASARAEAPAAAPFAVASVGSIAVDEIDTAPGGAPYVDVYFRALGPDGRPAEHLRAADVRIREDDAELPRDAVVSLQRIDESGLGLSVVLALDHSRRLLGEPFERARASALAFLGKLAPPDQAALVAFSGQASVVVPFGQSLEEVRARVEGLVPDRTSMTTAVFDGIHRAAELVRTTPARPRRAFVVAFSHGKDGGSGHPLEDVTALVSGSGGEARIPVFTIGYAGRGAEGIPALEKIAAASGAAFAREADAAQLYGAALAQMRGSYVARVATRLDGARHRIAVEVEGRSDAREAAYPQVAAPPAAGFQTHWQLPALFAAAILAGLAYWLSRGVRGGAEPATGEVVPRLRFVDGPLADRTVELQPERTRIGALADNDLAVTEPSVSRNHAEIRADRGGWLIVDLGSTNGTRVNGKKVDSARLRPGDRIRVGEVELVFEL